MLKLTFVFVAFHLCLATTSDRCAPANSVVQKTQSTTVKHAERITQLHDLLKHKGNASTKYLSKVLDVSESTIRRDIDFLASMHKEVGRVHGGAVLRNAADDIEYMFELKQSLNTELKRRIATGLVDELQDRDRLLLDSGTTCLHAAMQLHRRNQLRVVTTDVKVADELAKYENIESIIVGGLIRPGYYTIGETLALEMLDHFSIDRTIMSADAIDLEKGVSNFSIFEVGVKKKIIDMAGECILIADHTKFDKTSFYTVADLARFHTIVTTKELPEELAAGIREKGIKLILA